LTYYCKKARRTFVSQVTRYADMDYGLLIQ
jgi:hypothetical protein